MELNQLFTNGQTYLLYLIREQLYKNFPALFEQLDFEDDAHFSDPLLFGYFNQLSKGLSMEQILFHHLEAANYPVHAFNGTITLPGLAYLRLADRGDQVYELERKEGALQLHSDQAFEVIAPVVLDRHNNIEVCLYTNPYYNHLCTSLPGAKEVDASLEKMPETAPKYIAAINEAFDLIKAIVPEEYEIYTTATQRIVLFDNPSLVSFVTRQVHGTIFFNVNQHANTSFFVEELIHQCSHNAFNAMTAKIDDFLKVRPETLMSELIDAPHDFRDVYGAYHGVYTVSTGVHILLKMLEEDLDLSLKRELLGRLAIKKTRFRIGVDQVDMKTTFTPKGMALYDFLDQRCFEEMKAHPEIFDAFDFSNQHHGFSNEKFEAANKEVLNELLYH